MLPDDDLILNTCILNRAFELFHVRAAPRPPRRPAGRPCRCRGQLEQLPWLPEPFGPTLPAALPCPLPAGVQAAHRPAKFV